MYKVEEMPFHTFLFSSFHSFREEEFGWQVKQLAKYKQVKDVFLFRYEGEVVGYAVANLVPLSYVEKRDGEIFELVLLDPSPLYWYIDYFILKEKHQRRGWGREFLRLLLTAMPNYPVVLYGIMWTQGFWEQCGFVSLIPDGGIMVYRGEGQERTIQQCM